MSSHVRSCSFDTIAFGPADSLFRNLPRHLQAPGATMRLDLNINGVGREMDCASSDTLFDVIRRLGLYGIKFGDEQGLTGSDTVLLDGRPVNSGSMLALQAEGHAVATIEALGEHPD